MADFPDIPPGRGIPLVDLTTFLLANPVMAALDARYDDRYARGGVDATQRLMALLYNETQDTSMLLVSDSTANENGEWFRLLVDALAPEWPRWTVNYRLWNDGAAAYDAAVTIQTGTGSRVLTVYNASVAGASSAFWQGTRARKAIYDLSPHPTLILVSIGHNEQATASLWWGKYIGLTESIAWGCSASDILLIAQNPATGNTYQQQRREIYREIATRRGYGFIDVCQAFIDTGNPAGLTLDGIHPTPAGSALWRDTVLPAFSYQSRQPPRPLQPSPLYRAGKNILLNSDLAAITAGTPDNWGPAGPTVIVDTVNKETYTIGVPATGGGAVTSKSHKLTATGTGQLLGQYCPVPAQACWVTYGMRAYSDVGVPSTVGRMGISATGVSVIQDVAAHGNGDFSWSFVTAFKPAGPQNVRAFFYVDSGATLGAFTLDRQFLTLGKWPIAI